MSLFILIIFPFLTNIFFNQEVVQGHLDSYTETEIALIEKDLEVVRSVCFDNKQPTPSPFYLATAGAPGSRKTTILERFLRNHPNYQTGVYIDYDQRGLKLMAHTYVAKSLNFFEVSQTNDYLEVIQKAYDKWRPASHYITLSLFEEAIAKRHSLVFGTTSTGAFTEQLLQGLKHQGYSIILLLCSCDDSLRYEAVNYRNQNIRFYQSSPEDALNKGKLFPQRMEVYKRLADTLYFYWSDDLVTPERLAAVWQEGALEVLDQEALKKFEAKYEEDRQALGGTLPSFSDMFGT